MIMSKKQIFHIERVQLSDGSKLEDVVGTIDDGFLVIDNEPPVDTTWINLRLVDKLHGVMLKSMWDADRPGEDCVAW